MRWILLSGSPIAAGRWGHMPGSPSGCPSCLDLEARAANLLNAPEPDRSSAPTAEKTGGQRETSQRGPRRARPSRGFRGLPVTLYTCMAPRVPDWTRYYNNYTTNRDRGSTNLSSIVRIGRVAAQRGTPEAGEIPVVCTPPDSKQKPGLSRSC